MFDNCINGGIFLTFQLGQAVPIYKNGCKNQYFNYHLITIAKNFLKNAFMNKL